MIKAVIFDMYETLITLWYSNPYMGKEMAEEAGIRESVFREIWDPSDNDRTLGLRRFENVLEDILKANNCYTEEIYNRLVNKRIRSKVESFNYLHKDVLPMLDELKTMGIKIGLVSNCYQEELEAIKDSALYPFFDVACMSCEVRLKKPDERIFKMCVEKLGVCPKECLYCGDGGSNELEVAKSLGMHTVQALWYLREGSGQPVGRMPEYKGAENPLDLIKIVKNADL